jgi:hypothetical protein
MLPVDVLHMMPRDLSLKHAADVLAEAARDRGYRLARAAIFAAAAALDPDQYGAEADHAAAAVPAPCDAHEAILRSALAEMNAARHGTVDGACESLKRAHRIASLSTRTAWYAALVDEVRAALERAALLPRIED